MKIFYVAPHEWAKENKWDKPHSAIDDDWRSIQSVNAGFFIECWRPPLVYEVSFPGAHSPGGTIYIWFLATIWAFVNLNPIPMPRKRIH